MIWVHYTTIMREFTLHIYKTLLSQFLKSNYIFLSFEQYFKLNKQRKLPHKFVILRHDVDKKPSNSLMVAKLENKLKIQASYYFRTINNSYDPQIIKSIVYLEHEIGYHYEDFNKNNGLLEITNESFKKNLCLLRKLYPVRTICMHGNPRAKFDEGLLWKQLDKTKLGLLGEPYHSIDFDTMFYLTDTGRRWDGYKVSIWDKVPQQKLWNKQGLTFHSTHDIIMAIRTHKFPNQVMITTHPQRWTNSYSAWLKELIVQSLKNIIKRGIIKLKSINSKD